MIKKAPLVILQGLAAVGTALLAACTTTGGGAAATVPVNPMCTILAVDFAINPKVDVALVSERTDATVNHGFTRFRGIGNPRGNPAVGFTPDVYGISEAWSRNSAGTVVYRAQAHPARRPTSGDFNGSGWSIQAQDATGTWSPVFAAFSSTRSMDDQDDPATGGRAVPQLMPVGIASPQVFGCAGLRSDDKAVRSTWLIEAVAPNAAARAPGRVDFIQDLLNGDDRFVPNAPGPLIGPATPPTPTITGRPGNPVRDGSVQCAMTQFEDDVTTRELHMLAVHNGRLYHSMASSFGPATTGSGSTFNRFRTVSPWGDVGQALGRNFGNIVAAAVAARPRSISVFFVAESGGIHKLWHAVRFSAGGGSWRAADDVLALNGGHSSGAGFPFRVAAGLCPVFDRPQDRELVYVMWNDARNIFFGRIVSTPQQWLPGRAPGVYSPLFDLSGLLAGTSDASRQNTINSMTIVARPFRDDARPPP